MWKPRTLGVPLINLLLNKCISFWINIKISNLIHGEFIQPPFRWLAMHLTNRPRGLPHPLSISLGATPSPPAWTTLPHYVRTPGHPLELRWPGSWHFLVARSVKSLPGIKLQQVRVPLVVPSPLGRHRTATTMWQLVDHNATWHAPHVQQHSRRAAARVANMSSLFKRWPKNKLTSKCGTWSARFGFFFGHTRKEIAKRRFGLTWEFGLEVEAHLRNYYLGFSCYKNAIFILFP